MSDGGLLDGPGAGALLGRPVLEVAPDLLGRTLVHEGPAGTVVVRLTEVEAYAGPGDPGSHAHRGVTPRTEVMFGPPGRLYVYFSYGMHWCVNLVCGPAGTASAVLLRGGEVAEGHDLARSRRPAARIDRDLARGPARLASALGIDGAHDGRVLGEAQDGDRVALGAQRVAGEVRTGPRVGVSGEGGDGVRFPWRFWLDGEPTVSAYRPAVQRAIPRRAARAGSGRLESGSAGRPGPRTTEGPS